MDIADAHRSRPGSDVPALDVAAILVTRNSGADVVHAVASLHEPGNRPVEVVIVDHASTDGSLAPVRERFPATRILATGTNPGFAAGCNVGIAATRAPSVLLLNPDAALAPGALAAMVSHLRRHPRVGVVGPRLLNPDGGLQPSGYRAPGLLTETVRLLGLADAVPRAALRRSWLRRLLPDTGHFDRHHRTREVDLVTGACLLIRREVLDQIGGFDEEYFLYYEEIDLCLRARRRGWSVVHLPAAEARHAIGGSSRGARRVSWAARHLSRARFHRRHGSAARAATIRAIAAATVGLRLLREAVRRGRSRSRTEDRVNARDCGRVLGAILAPARGPRAGDLPAWLDRDR